MVQNDSMGILFSVCGYLWLSMYLERYILNWCCLSHEVLSSAVCLAWLFLVCFTCLVAVSILRKSSKLMVRGANFLSNFCRFIQICQIVLLFVSTPEILLLSPGAQVSNACFQIYLIVTLKGTSLFQFDWDLWLASILLHNSPDFQTETSM